jgi:hypothetical protein
METTSAGVPLIPAPRHWFSGGAVVGGLVTGYNVLLAIIQVAPITQSGLKWLLLAIGVFLSLATWYALARENARNEGREIETEKRLANAIAANDEKHGMTQAIIRQESAKVESTVAALTKLLASGAPPDSPEVRELAETAKASSAAIARVVGLELRAELGPVGTLSTKRIGQHDT